MSQQPLNPYAPPLRNDPVPTTRTQQRELVPLWIWLAVATLTSLFATPADPFSMFLALGYGLVCFWMGLVLGSRTYLILRLLLVVLWGAAIIWLVGLAGLDFFALNSIGYGLVSISLGMWAVRSIRYGRWRILAGFSLGYALGSVIGVVGTIFGAVFGTLLARQKGGQYDAG